MKRFTLMALIALTPAALMAQFKLTPASHGFTQNEANPMVLTKYMDPGKSGRNVTWDFRDLEVGNHFEGNIGEAIRSQSYTAFPEANTVLEEFGNMFVFRASDNQLEQIGFMSKDGRTKIQYSKPFVKMRYPFTYKSTFGGELEGDYLYNDRPIAHHVGTYTVTADARGTLLLPANRELNNVMRVKEVKRYDQTSNGSTTAIETVTYRWYVAHHRFPVLVLINSTVTANGGKHTSTSTMAAYNSQVISLPNPAPEAAPPADALPVEAISHLTLFPNPTQDRMSIQFMLAADAADAQVAIYSLDGRLMKLVHSGHLPAGQAQFEFSAKASGLSAGIYIVRLSANGAELGQKFVKE
ncbi:MAG: T9SS type A sorting domain-containing protein [Bacteroidales bacterium]|nr:T9SS type A sorting domain-containing protein [Bacteroidales bacterium]